MFEMFDQSHEDVVRAHLEGQDVSDPVKIAEVIDALQTCRIKIVQILKSTRQPDVRKDLRLLYEGLVVASEFLAQHKSGPQGSDQISSISDESVPAARET